jgi:hypothetical protein
LAIKEIIANTSFKQKNHSGSLIVIVRIFNPPNQILLLIEPNFFFFQPFVIIRVLPDQIVGGAHGNLDHAGSRGHWRRIRIGNRGGVF